MKLPLFPLPIFLLPEGVTRLRIFEQRYLKMIRIASKENGFAILMNSKESTLAKVTWASWVEIINFDQDDTGTLIIDVKCKSLVSLNNINTDPNNLRHADVSILQHWPVAAHDTLSKPLSSSLAEVFQQSSDLRQLYQNTFIDEPRWVIARWLELLPVELDIKEAFSNPHSLTQAKQLIHNIIHTEQVH